MFGFLGKLIGMGVKLFSKIKPAVQGAVRLFDKGKNIYSTVKNTVSNVPIVGSLAKEYIDKGEQKLAEISKNAIGITPSDVNQAVGMADRLTRPPGLMKSYRYKQVMFGKPKSLSLCAIGKRRMAINNVSESPKEESVKSEMSEMI